jgi:hypothetical protein
VYRFAPALLLTLFLSLVLLPASDASCPSCSTPTITPYRVTPYVQEVIAVPVAPDYYYSVGGHDSVEQIAKEVVKQLKKEGLPGPFAASRDDRERFRLMGNARVEDLDGPVLEIFNTSCIKCHKPGAARPGVHLFNDDRSLFIDPDAKKEKVRRRRVYEAVESGEMPKGSGPLPIESKELLRKWSER